MTIETKLPFDQEDIRSFSKEMNEPAWLTDFRLHALAEAKHFQCQNQIKQKLINGISLNFQHIL